jgi:biotin carboxyl carrier protein
MLRSEPDTAEGDDSARDAAALAEQLRGHLSDETGRRHAETPASPAIEQPAVERPAAAPSAPAAAAAAPKSGKRRLVLMGIIALIALAAAGYGVEYTLVGRFYVSTDDAYVRANNTTLGARVSGHIAAILASDNAVVHTGDVIFRIDDGDYRHPASHHRPHRPPGHCAGKRGRTGPGEPCLGGGRTEAGQPRLRPAADAEHQGVCHPRHVRTVRGRARPGRGGRKGGAGRL